MIHSFIWTSLKSLLFASEASYVNISIHLYLPGIDVNHEYYAFQYIFQNNCFPKFDDSFFFLYRDIEGHHTFGTICFPLFLVSLLKPTVNVLVV